MFDKSGNWFSQNSVLSVVDGVDTFTLELEFGVFDDTDFGVIIDFTVGLLNGTFDVLVMEQAQVQELSDFSFNEVDLSSINEGGLDWGPIFLYGGASLAIVAVIGGFVILNRRGSLSGLTSKLPGRGDRY